MSRLTTQGIVLVAMLLALPLASIGTSTDNPALSVAALAVFGLAALTPPVLRFAGDGDEEDA